MPLRMPAETKTRTKDGEVAACLTPAVPKLFIITGRCGRLANRMVLFANFVALAEEQGHQVSNPTFHSYATMFETTRRDIYCRYPAASKRSFFDVIPGVAGVIRGTRVFFRLGRAAGLLNQRVPVFGSHVITLRQSAGQEITELDGAEVQEKIRPARVVLVNGWNFRAPALVRRHAGKIKAYFRPISTFDEAASRAIEPLRQEAEVVVGVHIRRGDYANWKGGQCFFPVERYAAWMRELSEQFRPANVSFLVCSNEPRDAAEFPGLSVGFGPGSPVGDLYALARCDYIFGPLSTFTQWASFYGNKPLFHLYDEQSSIEREQFRVSDLSEVP